MQDAKFLVDKIKEDTSARYDAIISKAEHQAEEILQEARKESEKIWNDMRIKAKKDAEDERKRIISNSILESKKKVLEAKQDMIKKVFDMSIKKIRQMDGKEYELFLSKLILSLVDSKDTSIFVAYNDRSRLSSDFIENINKGLKDSGKKASVKYSDNDYDIDEGFVMSHGKFQIDASIKNLIDMQKDTLEGEIVKLLFE